MKKEEKKKRLQVNWFKVLRACLMLLIIVPYVWYFFVKSPYYWYYDYGWTFVQTRVFKVFWFVLLAFAGLGIAEMLVDFTLRRYFVKHEGEIITKKMVNYISWYIEKFDKKREISDSNQILLIVHANESEKLKKLLFDYYPCLKHGMKFLFLRKHDSLSKLQDEFMKEEGLPNWIIDSFIESHDSESLLHYNSITGRTLSDNQLKNIFEMSDMPEVFIASCNNATWLNDNIECMFIKTCLEKGELDAVYSYTKRKVKRRDYGLCADAELYLIENDFNCFRCYLLYTNEVTEKAIGKLIELSKTNGAAKETLYDCFSRNLVTNENALELFKLSLENDNFTKYYDLFVESGLANEMLAVLTLDNHVKVKMLSAALQGHTVYSHSD